MHEPAVDPKNYAVALERELARQELFLRKLKRAAQGDPAKVKRLLGANPGHGNKIHDPYRVLHFYAALIHANGGYDVFALEAAADTALARCAAGLLSEATHIPLPKKRPLADAVAEVALRFPEFASVAACRNWLAKQHLEHKRRRDSGSLAPHFSWVAELRVPPK